MLISNQNLRMYRKRARLIQEDIAYLIAMPDYANVSRMENGLREPSLELLFLYHLLFEMPLNGLFGNLADSIKNKVIERISLRITELNAHPPHPKIAERLGFLEHALVKLTSSTKS